MGGTVSNSMLIKERLALMYKAANRRRAEACQPRLTYKTLAETCGVSESAVNKWFSKKSRVAPNIENLIVLAPVLDCDVDFLLGIQDIPSRKMFDIHETTGLSGEAVDTLMSLVEAQSPVLLTISDLITSSLPLDIHSAIVAKYKDDYTRYGNQFISAKRMYAAEKAALFEDLTDFINKKRQYLGLDPLE